MEASAVQRPAHAHRARLPSRRRTDPALVARVRAGDERAFEELYDRYSASLLAFCRHMLGSREEGEDALQHTFMAAHRALRGGEEAVHLKAWLYAIARNRCVSVLRARREQAPFEDDAPGSPAAGLAAEVEHRAELRELVADLGRLPEDQRAALVLFELGDHAQDDIAEVLGVRREKVKALVFQAREALIGWRTAREIPCAEVREQLSSLRGSALRRAPLRRHVELCGGCREFAAQVRRQRAGLAVVLPVVPAAGLKSAVLSSVLGGGAAATAATTAATAGPAAAGAVAAKGIATKALVALAVAACAGGTGYVAVEQTAPAPSAPQRTVAAPARTAASTVAGQRPGAAAVTGAHKATPVRRSGRAPASEKRRHVRARGRTAAPGQAGAPGKLTVHRSSRAHGMAKAKGRATAPGGSAGVGHRAAKIVRAHPVRRGRVPAPAAPAGAGRNPAAKTAHGTGKPQPRP